MLSKTDFNFILQELVPEFYCLPEMFVNQNGFNFGKQDDGVEVKDVVLPLWAKNPEDFVRVNRMVNIYICHVCSEAKHVSKLSQKIYIRQNSALKKKMQSVNFE